MSARAPRRLFSAASSREAARLASVLREETVGGVLLAVAAIVALAWVNSPIGGAYEGVRDTVVGPAALNLDLTLGTWAADGLLAIFFFVAGLELKREFVAGDLKDPARATLPIVAAIGGMVVPAVFYLAITTSADADRSGWAVPAATDIAFALAVLAIVGSSLPAALRTFLLTLAVVDDLLAITIIAVFFTEGLQPLALAAALVPLGLFTLLVQREVRAWWVLLPLAAMTWTLVHESGVHATVAGVLLAFAVPVVRSDAAGGPEGGYGLAEHFERRIRPVSAGFAVPVFALLATGVEIEGVGTLADAATDPVAIGIFVGLVVGKPLGVLAAAWLTARLTGADLDAELGWPDVFGLALLAGVGFTVSLLISELAFGPGSELDERAKLAVLFGSAAAIALATVVLRRRRRDILPERPARGSA